MKIGIIHFSDIHFKSERNNNPLFSKIDKLILSLQNQVIFCDHIFIIISGDIAFSGQQSEYFEAKHFLNIIQTTLSEYSHKEFSIICVPGNHDCNFKDNQSTRNLIISGLEATNFTGIDRDIIDQCCIPQEEYFMFENEITDSILINKFKSKLVNIFEYSKDDYNIIFNCFNTSWTSRLHELQGSLAFPIQFFERNIFDNPATLKLNIIHHPLNWHNHLLHREFRNFLNINGDITLSGHEHETDVATLVDGSENQNIYIESNALQDSNNNIKSSFNFVFINLSENTYTINSFDFIGGNYKLKELIHNKPLLQNVNKVRIEYPLKTSFSRYLDSLSAPFLHKRAIVELEIDDLFVNPFLRNKNEETNKINIVNFQEILESPSPGKLIIIGDEISGKTTLCKKIYKNYYNEGFIPILIKGSKITSPTFEYIFNILLKTEFIDQYHNNSYEKYDSIDKNKIIIILDDFHACELRDQHRNEFINNINANFNNIIITSNSLLYLNSLPTTEGEFSEYSMYNILEFSYELRYELIKKWNGYGENELFGNSLLIKNEEYDHQISYFLGKNYLPHFPFIIITALQSIDYGNSSEQGFSYYYKYLIEESLKKNIKKADNFQFYNYFLSEYCFYMFENKLRKLSKVSFEDYFRKYTKKQKVRIPFNDVLNELKNSKIIRIDGDFVAISYNYIYYYYVATFISNNIDEPAIKALVIKLIERLYVDEFSSIIVFLSQVSSNNFITETLKTHADKYFSNFSPATLSTDIEHIDRLMNSVPKLILNVDNSEITRREEISRRTKAEFRDEETNKKYLSDDFDLNEDVSNISMLNTLVRAVKTFEIFGNVIKKNWGAYDGIKKEIYIESTFSLAMRTLSAYLNLMDNGVDEIIEYVNFVADKREIKDRNEIEKLAKRIIFHLTYLASHGIIKRLSNAISHKQLKDTIDELVEKNGTNSYKLVRLAIMLDHFGSLPNGDIKILLNKDKTFKKYILPKVLLQNFVRQYLYFYDIPYDERNRICSLVGIEIKEQRRIQMSSKEKKK